jgi:hypothetical protein
MSLEEFWKLMRQRPDMWVGPPGESRVLCLVRALLEQVGGSSRLALELLPDGVVVVRTEGAGVSLERTAPGLHGFDGDLYLVEISQDLRRAQEAPGLIFARGLCRRLEVSTVSRGKAGTMVCVRGDLFQPVAVEPSDAPEHTEIRIWLDPEIFGDASPSTEVFTELLRDVSRSQSVSATLHDRRGAEVVVEISGAAT